MDAKNPVQIAALSDIPAAIRDIEKRAETLNLSLCGLCAKVRLTYSTVRRWERGISSPASVAAFQKTFAALTTALAVEEARLVDVLIVRRAPAQAAA